MGQKSRNDLEVALRQNRWLEEVLERFDEIGLPDTWLVAGCIAQTIWNLGCRQPAEFGIKDIDLIYFDEQDLSFEAEVGHETRVRGLFRHLPIKLDVKNEARVHLWYEKRFGYPIKPYLSSAERSQPFQQLQPRLGYVGYGTNWSAAHPSDSTICSASLLDRIKGR